MTPNVLIQITVFDDSTGEPKKTIVHAHVGAYRWEIVRLFEELGVQVANIVDPT